MDGRDRVLDNSFVEHLRRSVKYQEVYLKPHAEFTDGLFNEEQLQQALGYKTPNRVYQTATDGGTQIVDKLGQCP